MNKQNKLFLSLLYLTTLLIACKEENNPVETAPQQKANFTVTVENISGSYDFIHSGAFNTPVGATSPGPLLPGRSYQFDFTAAPGMKLSFATMFVHSNDFFFAPGEEGIDLYDVSGNQTTGDITSQIFLWDSGTEVNQEPGIGVDQAPRQSAPNIGATDPDNTVRIATDDFANLPAVADVIKVVLVSISSTGFRLTIENVSSSGTLSTSDGETHAVPLAPGVYVIHSNSKPLFAAGQRDYGEGLMNVAEDGDPTSLLSSVEAKTGLTSLFAPGVYAVYSADNPIFTENNADFGEGLEALAEDGDPTTVSANVTGKNGVTGSGIFNTPVSASAPQPLVPGGMYQFSFEAEKGSKLTFATMFVQSNDIFAAPGTGGIDLFDESGNALSGDITSKTYFWDAGTEANEEPGIGANQAPRQRGTNTGMDENGAVLMLSGVNDGFTYPAVNNVIKITVESVPVN